MMRRVLVTVGVACLVGLVVTASRPAPVGPSLPLRLADRDFWRLSSEWSEPNGFFRSDNLTSNELYFQHVVADLVARTKPGDVYLGVGPEQNYTYMAAVKPAFAVVF